MKLSVKRQIFTSMMAELIWRTNQIPGYAVAANEVKRTQTQAQANAASGAGVAGSVHLAGLAVDLLLYIKGVYQRASDAYIPLGELWKAIGEQHNDSTPSSEWVEACWGGDFTKRDGNHFSLKHGGIR